MSDSKIKAGEITIRPVVNGFLVDKRAGNHEMIISGDGIFVFETMTAMLKHIADHFDGDVKKAEIIKCAKCGGEHFDLVHNPDLIVEDRKCRNCNTVSITSRVRRTGAESDETGKEG